MPNRYKANGAADCVPIAVAYREYGDGEWSNPDSYRDGLEMYETFYRSYNAHNLSRRRRIGRFMQGDPMIEVSMESYVFAGNNPVLFTDYFGDLEKEIELPEIIIEYAIPSEGSGLNPRQWWDTVSGGGGGEFGSGGDWSFLGDGGGGGGGGKKGGDNGDKLKGGKQKDRDRDIKQYPRDFQRWYHREWKPYTNPGRNSTPEELKDAHKTWESWGKPIVQSVTTAGFWTLVGIGAYETVKWGAAILLAPETGGTSLVGAAALP